MQQWKFNPLEGDNAVSDGDAVVFYIDDLNPEVIAKIVEIQNANPNGDFIPQLQEYLEGEERCSPDERDFVLEQVTDYLKLSKASTEEVNNATPQQPAQQGPTETPQGPGSVKQDPPPPPQPQKPAAQQGGRGSRQTSTSRQGTGAGASRSSSSKAVSSEELIKQLESKIALIKLLDKTPEIQVPDGLDKTSREIMVDFQREFNTLKESYLERIKNL